MGYFAQATVTRMSRPDGHETVDVQEKLFKFSEDALMSWDSGKYRPSGSWLELSPGTLYVERKAVFDDSPPHYDTTLIADASGSYTYDYDMQYSYHREEQILLHVVLPPYMLPTKVEWLEPKDPASGQARAYAAVLPDRVAMTFTAVDRIQMQITFGMYEGDWPEVTANRVLPDPRVTSANGFLAGLRLFAIEVLSSLISKLIKPD